MAVEGQPMSQVKETVTQDDVEFFSHLKVETGSGKYNWLYGLVYISVWFALGRGSSLMLIA